MKKYNYHYNDDSDNYDNCEEGYWGYMRDRKADRKQTIKVNDKKSSDYDFDGYWGNFKDSHVNNDIAERNEFGLSESPNSILTSYTSPFQNFGLGDETNEDSIEKGIEYDYKNSKFKIQAKKRDE